MFLQTNYNLFLIDIITIIKNVYYDKNNKYEKLSNVKLLLDYYYFFYKYSILIIYNK